MLLQAFITLVYASVNPAVEVNRRDPKTSAVIYSVFLVFLGIFSFIVSKMKIGERISVILGMTLIIAGINSFLLSKNLATAIFSQVLLSLGIAIVEPAINSLYSKFSRNYSSWAFFSGMDYIIEGLSIIALVLISSIFGEKVVYALITLIGTAMVGKIHKEIKSI